MPLCHLVKSSAATRLFLYKACFRAGLMMALSFTQGSAQDLSLESRRLHLGKRGQFEWEMFQHQPVDAERLELRFTSNTNRIEQTLKIGQRDVKQNWPVLLNGRKIGALTLAEIALECVLAVPVGALLDGENVLVIEAPAALDDIEVGPVILTSQPVVEAIAGSTIQVVVTDAQTSEAIPCRLTLTRPDGTLQPLRAEPKDDVASRVGVVYAKHGKTTLAVPPGEYVLHAGRGFEWCVGDKEAVFENWR